MYWDSGGGREKQIYESDATVPRMGKNTLWETFNTPGAVVAKESQTIKPGYIILV
jgi:hypothetical protein